MADKSTLKDMKQKFAAMQKSMAALEKEIKQAESRAAAHAVKRPKIWRPKFKEKYYYIHEDGSAWATDERIDRLFKHGNCFQLREQADHAARIQRSLNFQLNFAFAAGGDGKQQIGSYLLGQEGVLKGNGLSYPNAVYFPNEAVAKECYKALSAKGWLFP